jgi:ATP-binding cassette subfamily C (CFTR/MRP) protein 1
MDEEFSDKGHTVIVVAHRLGVLLDHTRPRRDGVVLMRDGRLHKVISGVDSETLESLDEHT